MNVSLLGWQHYIASLQEIVDCGDFDAAAICARHLQQLISNESKCMEPNLMSINGSFISLEPLINRRNILQQIRTIFNQIMSLFSSAYEPSRLAHLFLGLQHSRAPGMLNAGLMAPSLQNQHIELESALESLENRELNGVNLAHQIIILLEMVRLLQIAPHAEFMKLDDFKVDNFIRYACQKLGLFIIVLATSKNAAQVDPSFAQRLLDKEQYFAAFRDLLSLDSYGRIIQASGLSLAALAILSAGFLTSQPNWRLNSNLFGIMSHYASAMRIERSRDAFYGGATRVDFALAVAAVKFSDASVPFELRVNILRQIYSSTAPQHKPNVLLLLVFTLIDTGKMQDAISVLESQDRDIPQFQISLAHILASSRDFDRSSQLILPIVQNQEISESLTPSLRIQALKIVAHLYRASGADSMAEIQILNFLKRELRKLASVSHALFHELEERLCQLHCAEGDTKSALLLDPEYLPAQWSCLNILHCYQKSRSQQVSVGSISLQILISICNFGLLCCITKSPNVNADEVRASFMGLKEAGDVLHSSSRATRGDATNFWVKMKNGLVILESQMLLSSLHRLQGLSSIVLALEFLDCAASGDMVRAQQLLKSAPSDDDSAEYKFAYESAFELRAQYSQGQDKFAIALGDWSKLIARLVASAFLPTQLDVVLRDAVSIDDALFRDLSMVAFGNNGFEQAGKAILVTSFMHDMLDILSSNVE